MISLISLVYEVENYSLYTCMRKYDFHFLLKVYMFIYGENRENILKSHIF